MIQLETEKMKEAIVSSIHVPVAVSLKKLETMLNANMGEVLFADAIDQVDDLEVVVKRTGDIRMSMQGQTLSYDIPLDVQLLKKTFFGKVRGEGALLLSFTTDIDIESDWNLKTQTDLVNYTWSRKPMLKVGGIELPLQGILNQLVRRMKDRFEDTIDAQIRANADLKTQVQQGWQLIQEPILVSPEYNAWLLLRPQSLGMDPLLSDNNIIKSTLHIEAFSEVYVGEKPAFESNGALPQFQLQVIENKAIRLSLKAGISFQEAERQVNQLLKGQTFSQKGKTIQIEHINITGRGNDIVIDADLSGDFTGKVELEGKPYFDTKIKRIQVEDLKFEVKTKNLLHKAAAFLFKKELVKLIEQSLSFPIDEKIEEMRQLANQQLENHQLPNGLQLQGVIEQLDIEQTYLSKTGLTLQLSGAGKLQVTF